MYSQQNFATDTIITNYVCVYIYICIRTLRIQQGMSTQNQGSRIHLNATLFVHSRFHVPPTSICHVTVGRAVAANDAARSWCQHERKWGLISCGRFTLVKNQNFETFVSIVSMRSVADPWVFIWKPLKSFSFVCTLSQNVQLIKHGVLLQGQCFPKGATIHNFGQTVCQHCLATDPAKLAIFSQPFTNQQAL